MKKQRRFLAAFLAAALALQPVWTYAQAEQPEAEYAQTEQPKTEYAQAEQPEAEYAQAEQPEAEYAQAEQPETEYAQAEQPEISAAAEPYGYDGFFSGSDEAFYSEPDTLPETGTEGFSADAVNDGEPAEISETDEVTAGAVVDGSGSAGRIRSFSAGYYSESYGAQLDTCARALYDLLVENYITNYATNSGIKFFFTLPEMITFAAATEESDGVKTLVKDQAYETARSELKAIVQSATDAFSYDYPQAFWFRGCAYTFKVKTVRDTSYATGWRGQIAEISLDPGPKEIYENAHEQMGEFMTSVTAAAAKLTEQTKGMNTYYKVKTIHDYVCTLATYQNDGTLLVHTAASAFLSTSPAFVCEGYAKTFKILCDRLGIESVCVSGLARSSSTGSAEAHMWNYVHMSDGNWYLVDATWDDSGNPSPPRTTYFLVGRNSMGLQMTIGEERVEYTDFSSTGFMNFVLPVLSENAYDPQEVLDISKATAEIADQTYTGKALTPEVSVMFQGMLLENGRDYTVTYTDNIEEGTAHALITGTGDYKGSITAEFSILPCPHAWGGKKVVREASCTAQGKAAYQCSLCGAQKTEAIAKLKPTIKLNATTIRLKVGQSFTIKVSGLAKGDSVKSWKSSSKTTAVVNSKGKITGKKAGTATVTVKLASGLSKKITVKVQKSTVRTTKITLNSTKVTLAKKGKSFQLQVTLKPLTSQEKVTYTSSDPKVATVSSKGKIVAKKKGTAKITVRSGSKKVTCKVTVKQ